jgi:hypothetical protein
MTTKKDGPREVRFWLIFSAVVIGATLVYNWTTGNELPSSATLVDHLVSVVLQPGLWLAALPWLAWAVGRRPPLATLSGLGILPPNLDEPEEWLDWWHHTRGAFAEGVGWFLAGGTAILLALVFGDSPRPGALVSLGGPLVNVVPLWIIATPMTAWFAALFWVVPGLILLGSGKLPGRLLIRAIDKGSELRDARKAQANADPFFPWERSPERPWWHDGRWVAGIGAVVTASMTLGTGATGIYKELVDLRDTQEEAERLDRGNLLAQLKESNNQSKVGLIRLALDDDPLRSSWLAPYVRSMLRTADRSCIDLTMDLLALLRAGRHGAKELKDIEAALSKLLGFSKRFGEARFRHRHPDVTGLFRARSEVMQNRKEHIAQHGKSLDGKINILKVRLQEELDLRVELGQLANQLRIEATVADNFLEFAKQACESTMGDLASFSEEERVALCMSVGDHMLEQEGLGAKSQREGFGYLERACPIDLTQFEGELELTPQIIRRGEMAPFSEAIQVSRIRLTTDTNAILLADACYVRGRALRTASEHQTHRSRSGGLMLYELGCNRGSALGCNGIGFAGLRKIGLLDESHLARDLIGKLNEALLTQEPKAMDSLGQVHQEHWIQSWNWANLEDPAGALEQDLASWTDPAIIRLHRSTALQYFNQGCDLDNGTACLNREWALLSQSIVEILRQRGPEQTLCGESISVPQEAMDCQLAVRQELTKIVSTEAKSRRSAVGQSNVPVAEPPPPSR